MIKTVNEIFKTYNQMVYYRMSDYTQFTLDFLEEAESEIQDKIDDEEEFSNERLGSMIYKIDCIIDIAKDGKDKELFIELKNKLEELE